MEILKKALTVIYVDILSILCIPIFLLSLILRMLGAVAKKFVFIPTLALIVIAFGVIHMAVYQGIGTVLNFIILFIFLGLATAIAIFLFGFVSAIITAGGQVVGGVLDTAGFGIAKLFSLMVVQIEKRLQAVNLMHENVIIKILFMVCGLPFIVLYIVYFLLKTLVKYCTIFGVAASAGVIVKSWMSLNASSKSVIGVEFGTLITMYDTRDSIMSWIQLIGIVGIQIALIMFISIEWASTAIDFENDNVDDYLKNCFRAFRGISRIEIEESAVVAE